MILSPAQLRDLAASVGFPDPTMAAAVAMAESYGHTDASNIVTNPPPGYGPERSFGLWQVNTLASPQYSEASLLDPLYNARAAYVISKGGASWDPWRTTIQSGGYKQYLPPGYAPPPAPATPAPFTDPFATVTPPARAPSSTALVTAAALALTAAAGFAAYHGRQRRQDEPVDQPGW